MQSCPKMQAVVEQLAKQHNVDIRKKGVCLRLELAGYDRLVIQAVGSQCVSVAHLWESQGYSIPEPDVSFLIDATRGWIPINITQSLTGYQSYAQLSEDGTRIVRYDEHRQADLASFCTQWAENLRSQKWQDRATRYEPERSLPLPDGEEPRFPLGQVVMTPGAQELLEMHKQTPKTYLARHVTGDWGTLDPHDSAQNQWALAEGGRLMSVYIVAANSSKLWIITEWNRSVTTLLLPSEY